MEEIFIFAIFFIHLVLPIEEIIHRPELSSPTRFRIHGAGGGTLCVTEKDGRKTEILGSNIGLKDCQRLDTMPSRLYCKLLFKSARNHLCQDIIFHFGTICCSRRGRGFIALWAALFHKTDFTLKVTGSSYLTSIFVLHLENLFSLTHLIMCFHFFPCIEPLV